MTLDDLIEQLQTLRANCPASGSATVNGGDPIEATYVGGAVWLAGDSIEDEDDFDYDGIPDDDDIEDSPVSH